MAKSPSVTTSVNERMKDILQGLKDNLGGVESIFLIDLETAKLLSSYPQEESKDTEFIGTILGHNVHQFEAQAGRTAQSLFVTEMEIQTDDGKQIFVSRVERNILLCLVGSRELKTGFAKRLCEGPVREDILSTLERMGFQIGRR